ncbi:uncharacterized protein LOC131998194 [Stomoxys calcitrans]|uniref:uncharacterized protein LOC131998194 n=1 Tax=Stomoxys calcitrans TaxID=35570 RepID=UPI0027E349EC|nr:uncharacterized protein LOC131998194 [Stomoxys calcitrans]
MANKTLCNIIAYISAILSGLGTIFLVFLFVVAVAHKDEPIRDSNGHYTGQTITGTHIAMMAIQVLSTGAMFVASVLLIIGIKRDRHSFIAPWVIVVAISVVLNILQLFLNTNNLVSSIVAIVIQIAIWYPIFSFYRELRKNGNSPPAAYNPQAQPMYRQ